ncbi:hypothetical protein LINGRAHAP2_LOCUS30739, partial [Linum grandiflorum]
TDYNRYCPQNGSCSRAESFGHLAETAFWESRYHYLEIVLDGEANAKKPVKGRRKTKKRTPYPSTSEEEEYVEDKKDGKDESSVRERKRKLTTRNHVSRMGKTV